MLSSTFPTHPVLPRIRTLRPRKISEGDSAGAEAAPAPVEECCIGPLSIAPGPGFPACGDASVEGGVAGLRTSVRAAGTAAVRHAGRAAGDRLRIASEAFVAARRRQVPAHAPAVARFLIEQRGHAAESERAQGAVDTESAAAHAVARSVIAADERRIHRAAAGAGGSAGVTRQAQTAHRTRRAAQAGLGAGPVAADAVLAEAARAIGRDRAREAERQPAGQL